jgi:transcriptional regulator with XRE-family HTH domain
LESTTLPPIAENLKRLRTAAGLTQQQLAVAAGLHASVISQIEQGTNTDPRMSTLMGLAAALGVGVADIITTPEEPKPKKGGRR